MSAPVKARPEGDGVKARPEPPVKARPEPGPPPEPTVGTGTYDATSAPPVKARSEPAAQVVGMVMVIDAESPLAPVATMVYDSLGVASNGIDTVVEKEGAEMVIVEYLTPLRVKVTDSGGGAAKFVPPTVKDPPGTEHPELVVIPGATVG
jgi:hypothetical protein